MLQRWKIDGLDLLFPPSFPLPTGPVASSNVSITVYVSRQFSVCWLYWQQTAFWVVVLAWRGKKTMADMRQ